MMRQDEYKKLYIQESEDFLQEMNRSLMLLEKDQDNKPALDAIFRSAHTLKSMSASMGYEHIAALAHKMEDVLHGLRSGSIQVTGELVNLLFRSFDSLEEQVAAVQRDKEIKPDIGPLLTALSKAVGKEQAAPEGLVDGKINLNIFEKKALIRAQNEGYKAYHVKVTLEKGCILKSVRAFMVFRNLHDMGEVIKSVPDSQSLEEEKFGQGFDCVFITREKEDNIAAKVMEILDVQKTEVDPIPVEAVWDDLVTPADKGAEKDIAIFGPHTEDHVRRIQSVRVDIARLDKLMNLAEELAISRLRLVEVGAKLADTDLKSVIEALSRLTDDLQSEIMQARLVPVNHIFDRFPRLMRDLAQSEGKSVKFDIIGGDIELDRTVLDDIGDPLIHLLKNAIDHGIEPPDKRRAAGKPAEGRIMLSARREKTHVYIDVEDDGNGINIDEVKKAAKARGIIREEALNGMSSEEVLLLTAHSGFTTKKDVTEISGRGVGLDVVKEKTESLGGSMLIESVYGKGTKISMRLPVTTAVIKALLVEIGEHIFAIPIPSVTEIIPIREEDIKTIEGKEAITHRDRVLPVIRVKRIFDGARDKREDIIEKQARNIDKLNIVIVEFGRKQCGLIVDKLLVQQDIVIKQLTKELKQVRGFAGATILGNGEVALVIDVATLV